MYWAFKESPATRLKMHLFTAILFEAVSFLLSIQGHSGYDLYRDSMHNEARFVKHPNGSLNVTPIAFIKAIDNFCCVHHCLNEKRCFSFNLAIAPINNMYECQLLSTDKYNSSSKFENSKNFHHYSIEVTQDNAYDKLYLILISRTVIGFRFADQISIFHNYRYKRVLSMMRFTVLSSFLAVLFS